MQTILSCTGIRKTFTRSVISAELLQDRLLHRHFGRKKWKIDALDDVSFTINSGEWIGIYGANGSGKTTLLRILSGLMHHDAGTVTVGGKLSCFLGLGTGFHPERTARENIRFHGLLHGMSDAQMKNLYPQILEFAGTESHQDLPIKCYSTGMQLRLAFAASVFIDADLYIFDELLAVGDEAFQKKCEEKLRALKTEGKSAILVSHDKSQLDRLCHRVLFMENGKLLPERKPLSVA